MRRLVAALPFVLLACHFASDTDAACRTTADCPDGFVCAESGFCSLSLPGVDAGPAHDGGAMQDAGMADAGRDAGVVDAGDTGTPDGGALDAGDAGILDGGDAGVIDGGVDAGRFCAVGNGGCSVDATCTGSGGSVQCDCYVHYSGNGVSCSDDWSEWPVPPDAPSSGQYVVGNGAVVDSSTGLEWEQDVVDSRDTKAGAFAHCASLSLGGFAVGSWRLPSYIELMSIVSLGSDNPAIDATSFPSTPTVGFWSSSTYATLSGNSWVVFFSDGTPGHAAETFNYAVRCVH